MLLSVKERSSEIGVRIAVGARSSDVLFQFLLEASVLSVAGGGLGVIAGASAVGLLQLFGVADVAFSVSSIILSIAVSLVIGILSGSMPAMRASRVQPVRSLRGM